MGMKSFLIKKALQAKGMSKDQAEAVATQIAENPELANQLKALEDNKEVKALFDSIQKEIEEKTKGGMPEAYASMAVMTKYKDQIAKHKDALMPLMQLMGGLGMK